MRAKDESALNFPLASFYSDGEVLLENGSERSKA